MMINGNSCASIISKPVVEKMGLKTEPYLQPYNATWMNKTIQSITQCWVSILIFNYQGHFWCDILDINIAHILLGRSWLYDLNVTTFGKSNTYEFNFNGKTIVLKPI